MFGIGAGEFIVILVVGLIVFGPSKLPEIGRALGKALREFRKAQAALSATLNDIDKPTQNPTPRPATVDDVINLAKERPIVKENSDEKNLNGNSNDAPVADARASHTGSGRGADGVDKQS